MLRIARAARLYAAPKLEQFYFKLLEFHTQRLDLLRRYSRCSGWPSFHRVPLRTVMVNVRVLKHHHSP
jgi:hypothetical protein